MGKKIKIFITQPTKNEKWIKRYVEAEAIKIKGWEHVKLAVHNQMDLDGNRLRGWVVTDIKTGAAIGHSETKFDALIDAEMKLSLKTHSQYDMAVELYYKKVGIESLPVL